MVEIRDELPKKADGTIDIEQWVERVGENRGTDERTLLLQAAYLNLEHGGHHLTAVNESCLRQGLLTAESLMTLEPDIGTLLAAITYFPAHYGELRLETIQEALGQDVANLVKGVIQITTKSYQVK